MNALAKKALVARLHRGRTKLVTTAKRFGKKAHKKGRIPTALAKYQFGKKKGAKGNPFAKAAGAAGHP